METLNDILTKVSTIVSQTTDITAGSDEYNLWTSFVNQAQKEGAEVTDFRFLYTEHNTLTSQSTGNATIALPFNFDRLTGFPMIDGTEYPEINPWERQQYLSTEKYCYLLNTSSRQYLVVNPGTLASGTSIFVPYRRSLASLVSPADIPEFPSTDYLLKRTVALIWEAREDERFQQAKMEAEKILSRTVENENTRSPGYDDSIPTQLAKKFGFRIGRN